MTSAQRRDRLTTHSSESIPVVKRRISVYIGAAAAADDVVDDDDDDDDNDDDKIYTLQNCKYFVLCSCFQDPTFQ